MSVDPVKTSSPGIDCRTPEKRMDVTSSQIVASSGNAPKAEIARTQKWSRFALNSGTCSQSAMGYAGKMTLSSTKVVDKQSGAMVLQVVKSRKMGKDNGNKF